MPGQKSLGFYVSLAWTASLHVGVSKSCWEISIQPFSGLVLNTKTRLSYVSFKNDHKHLDNGRDKASVPGQH